MGLENPIHLMIVMVVVLMVFGAKRLPDMGRSLGDGLRGFKEAIGGETGPTHPEPLHVVAANEQPVAEPVTVTTPIETATLEHDHAAA